jgi:hypothetical protein
MRREKLWVLIHGLQRPVGCLFESTGLQANGGEAIQGARIGWTLFGSAAELLSCLVQYSNP